MIAQARLGPGRIHHAMRAIGMAERALALMVDRAKSRIAFGEHLPTRASSRSSSPSPASRSTRPASTSTRRAWLIDQHGAKGARTEIAGIKVAAPAMATRVIDRAIEVFGGSRRLRRHPARLLLRVGAGAAHRRRPRRRAPPHHRPSGTEAQPGVRRLTQPSGIRMMPYAAEPACAVTWPSALGGRRGPVSGRGLGHRPPWP